MAGIRYRVPLRLAPAPEALPSPWRYLRVPKSRLRFDSAMSPPPVWVRVRAGARARASVRLLCLSGVSPSTARAEAPSAWFSAHMASLVTRNMHFVMPLAKSNQMDSR